MRLFVRQHESVPFAGYLEEILAVEGFVGWEKIDVTDRRLTGALLEGADLALLAPMPLKAPEREALADYVRGGGRLVAIRPPVELASLFGVSARGLVLKRGHYLQFDAEDCPPEARSTDVPLQVHAEADCYEAGDARTAAWFCWGNGARRQFPAATLCDAGRGKAAMLAFDLAGSTVLLHQGLPEQASTGARADPGALGQYKPDGHFVGHLDVTRATIPQADLMQRLLGALIERLSPAPLPRLWYFPDGEPGLAFLNGDSDGMRLDDLEAVLSILEPRGGRYTCYLLDEEPLPPRTEAALREKGHAFGKHVWAGNRPTPAEMAEAITAQIGGFRRRYGYTPLTNRGHCLIWPGWTQMASFLAGAGVRIDSNFVGCHCGNGYLNGSGLPVKFMSERGQLIDLYEQSTQWEDDVALWHYFEQLPYDVAVEKSLETLRQGRETYHTVVNFNFHPIHIRKELLNTAAWITAVADACARQHLPMISGDAWARFNDARRRVTLSGYEAATARRRVRFTLTAPDAVTGLTLSLPATWDGAPFRVAIVDGQSLPHRTASLHAGERAFLILTFAAGQRRGVEIEYGNG